MMSFFRRVRSGAGQIRGQQVADAVGGRVDPQSGYENDVCVYIEGRIPEREPKCAYHDVMDCGMTKLKRVRQKTRGPLLAVGREHQAFLNKFFDRTRTVYLVPQHHCNFDNERRPDRPVRIVGCIGGPSSVQWPHDAMESMMRKIGMKWRFSPHNRRKSVVAFYRGLDVQVCFRPTHARGLERQVGPLKLANAGSFGIPTVAYPEPGYTAEWRDECLWATNMKALVNTVRQLKENPEFYAERAEMALKKAEEYHIHRIAGLYRALPVE